MARPKNPNLKKANDHHGYEIDQIYELQKCMEDPIYFIKKYVQIEHPVKGSIPFQLYPYQERLIRAYVENRFNIVLSARQTGKALALDTELPTPSGWTTMANINVGDYVLDANGKPTLVTGISSVQHNRPCYNVHFSTGEIIVADADHLWSVQYVEHVKNRDLVLTTQQIVDAGVLRNNAHGYKEGKFNVKTTKPLDLPEQNLPIDPYVLGVWLGDGTSGAPEITNHTTDKQIVDYVSDHYQCSNITHNEHSSETKGYYFSKLRKQLRELNVFKNKHIPINYLRASHDQRLALLQGLMDTDGYISNTGLCEITLTNKRLLEDVHELLSSLGLKGSIKQRHINGKLPHTRWSINFTPYTSQCIPFRLVRKASLVKEAPGFRRSLSTQNRTIVKIEPTNSVPVKCITVANPDHLYLVGRSMIPTHNSMSSGAFLLWYTCFQSQKTVLIASNKDDNAMEMIRRIRFMYEHLPHWIKPALNADGWNKHEIGFVNDSRILSTATSENAGRGFSISLLYLDEFAFVRDTIQEEFWASMTPTLSTGGSCIITSTPNGDTNIFAEIWRGAQFGITVDGLGGNGFKAMEVKWDEPPERDEKFKQSMIAKLGDLKWRQEFCCEFISSDPTLFNALAIQNLFTQVKNNRPVATLGSWNFFKMPKQNGTYLIGCDPSSGNGQDMTSIEVFEFPSLEQVAEYRSNTNSSVTTYQELKRIFKMFEKQQCTVYFSTENNGVGEGVIALFENDDAQSEIVEFVSEPGRTRVGMTTTGKAKLTACQALKEMVERKIMTIHSPLLVGEMKHFVRKNNTYCAKRGATDDSISACLIVSRILKEIATYDQDAYNLMYTHGNDGEQSTEFDQGYEPDGLFVG